MKIWKTPEPIKYKYSLGNGCCNEMKKNGKFFRVDCEGKVYIETRSPGVSYYEEEIYFKKCPFCGEPFEISNPKDTRAD
jgi:hypothetical protein